VAAGSRLDLDPLERDGIVGLGRGDARVVESDLGNLIRVRVSHQDGLPVGPHREQRTQLIAAHQRANALPHRAV
jgi:hypothetical protein